ncbi:MAG: hypothetical protein ACLTWR_11295 [Agathobaculum desmolans]
MRYRQGFTAHLPEAIRRAGCILQGGAADCTQEEMNNTMQAHAAC